MKQDKQNNFEWKKDNANNTEIPNNFNFDDFLKDDQSLDDKVTDVLDGEDLLKSGEDTPKKPVPPRPEAKASTEAPPRPTVQKVEPRPRIFVTPPDAGYREEKPKGMSERTKWIITAVVIVAAIIVVAVSLLSGRLPGGGLLTGATSTPSATLSPIETPANTDSQPTTAPTQQPTPEATSTVTVTAGKGGSISPDGIVTANTGDNVTFTINPESGYKLAQLLVDGVSVEPTNSYTFTKVYGSHTIYAVFEILPQSTPEPTPEPTPVPTPVPTEMPTQPATETDT